MVTTQDRQGIYHIDGPPVPGFVLEDKGMHIEVVYKVVSFYGTRDDCQRAQMNLMMAVQDELKKPQEGQTQAIVAPIIWWRRRPEIREDMDDSGRFQFYARFATTPALPADFWEHWGTEEGAMPKRATEVTG
jgi:hypothetical protein